MKKVAFLILFITCLFAQKPFLEKEYEFHKNKIKIFEQKDDENDSLFSSKVKVLLNDKLILQQSTFPVGSWSGSFGPFYTKSGKHMFLMIEGNYENITIIFYEDGKHDIIKTDNFYISEDEKEMIFDVRFNETTYGVGIFSLQYRELKYLNNGLEIIKNGKYINAYIEKFEEIDGDYFFKFYDSNDIYEFTKNEQNIIKSEKVKTITGKKSFRASN